MSRAEIAELQKLSTEAQRWIETGNLHEPPVKCIRKLAFLASKLANAVESKDQWRG